MGAHPNLRELRLAKCEIDDHGLALLVTHGLLRSRTLAKLDLRANRLTGFSGAELERLLAARPKIAHLDVSANKLGDDGAAALARTIRASKTITHIDVRSNGVRDTGLVALAEAVTAAPQLQTLLVWGNAFGNAGAASFTRALSDMAAGGLGVCHVDIRPYAVDGRAFVAQADVVV